MRPIYDSMHPSIVLNTSRQVSKCGLSSKEITTYDGTVKTLGSLIPEDRILSFDEETQKVVLNKVKSVEDNGLQTVFFIKTKTGREAPVTGEHPFWTLDSRWTKAEDLKVGDLVGASKKNSIEILGTDIIYDRIISIEKKESQPTTSIEMESPNNTFLIDGLVTHNSTTLANIMLANSVMYPNFKTLYISPTVDQTKIFSNDRVTTTMDQSPYIKKHLMSSALNQNVFTKQLKNHSKMYLRYALQSADRLRGISADAVFYDECYSKDTEVLTDSGWVPFDSLTEGNYKNYKYASSNKDQNLEYQEPERLIIKPFSGNLLEFSHRSFKLKVTPGHNMLISQQLNTGYYKNPKIKGWNLRTAEEVKSKNFKMLSSLNYEGHNKKYIVLPEYVAINNVHGDKYQNSPKAIKEETYDIKAFMQFMGWYLSEGHYAKDSNGVFISQQEGDNAKEIRECLTNLVGKNYTENINKENKVIVFGIHNRNLHDYVAKFKGSHDKYIPKHLLKNTNYLIDLLDSLYKGDAMRHHGEIWGDLNTASEQLANTTQIAWMHLNKKATIRKITERSGTVMYRVRPQKLNYQVFWNSANRVKDISYEGNVYCVTVPNSTLVVRDKIEKTAVVCGNCQDLLPDIIPVANETYSRSLYKWNMFSGTPKTSTTTLARLWQESTKNEWMSKCTAMGCKRWNRLDQENLGDHGVICRYCGKDLDTRQGTWVTTGDPNAIHQGFRVSVLMFASAPWVDWQRDITDYRKQHSEGVFFNEKLGLEYDSGAKPVTLDEVKACCTGGPMLQQLDAITGSKPTYMGIDYGPTNSKRSNTVMTVLQNDGPKLKVVYAKKYLGPEADYGHIHDDIPRQFSKWRSLLIGADYGLGEAPNAEIRKRLSFEKVIAYQHVANQKDRSMWNTKMPAFTLNRTQVMTEFFQMIKHRQIIFPRWEDFQPFGEDIMNINVDYDEERGKVRYTNSDPDDFFQALIYGGETARRHLLSSAEVY